MALKLSAKVETSMPATVGLLEAREQLRNSATKTSVAVAASGDFEAEETFVGAASKSPNRGA